MRKRQEDFKFKASLCYTVRSCLKIKSKNQIQLWEGDFRLCVDEIEDLLS